MTRRLIASLFTSILLAGMAFAEDGSFTFVQLCDPQLGMGGYEKDKANLKLAVEQINAAAPDFVIVCGDLTEDTINARQTVDYNEIVSGFDMPVYNVAGNHDILNNPTTTTLAYFRKNYGPHYQSFDHEGVRFVIVNTSLWKGPIEGETEKQDAWLRTTLSEAAGQEMPVVVAGHYAPFVSTADEDDQYFNLPSETRSELLNLFEENGVVAYLSGHSHQTQIKKHNDIEYVTSASTSRNFDKTPYGYRLWHVEGEPPYRHEWVVIEDAVEEEPQ